MSDVNYCFHNAVRRIVFVVHVVQTLLAFLYVARYGLRVVQIENLQTYFLHVVRSCADLGDGVVRVTFVPPGIGEVFTGRGFIETISSTSFGSSENAPRFLRSWYVSHAFIFEKSAGFWC